MVNEKKVRIMTQIALDETKYRKKEINEGGYFKSDYVRSHIISVLWNLTISYILILFLVALYHADYIFINVARLEYVKAGFIILGIYIGILVIGILFSYFHFRDKFAKNRRRLREYQEKLKELEEFYLQSREEAEHDTATGA